MNQYPEFIENPEYNIPDESTYNPAPAEKPKEKTPNESQ